MVIVDQDDLGSDAVADRVGNGLKTPFEDQSGSKRHDHDTDCRFVEPRQRQKRGRGVGQSDRSRARPIACAAASGYHEVAC